MQIEILGTGCPKCAQLAESVQQAVVRAGLAAEITKITDLNQITARGVLMTPALVIDGQVRVSGRVPSVAELEKLLVAAR